MDKHDVVKDMILDKIKLYVKDGCIDIAQFRKDYPKLYIKIPYYFGSIKRLLALNEWVKYKEEKDTPASLSIPKVKDKLAYYALSQLRKQGLTLQDISDEFGGTKVYIGKLITALESNLTKDKN